MGQLRFNESLASLWLERGLLVLATLVITWLLARGARWAFARLVDNVGFFRRHNTTSGETIGSSLGRLVSLVIWLFGLVTVLQILQLGQVLAPAQNLLNNIAAFIPNLVGAAVLFFIGLVIARIVRDIATTGLQTFNIDRLIGRAGAYRTAGEPAAAVRSDMDNAGADARAADDPSAGGGAQLSQTIGTVLYALIVIFFSIMALDVLNIQAVSGPASAMLNLILNAIPLIIGAAILLGLGYVISRFVVDLIKSIMAGLGADRAFGTTELLPGSVTLSSIVARVAQIAIILFFAIAATRLLNFPELSALLSQVLELGGQVIFGAVVIIVGFLLARMLARMIGGAEETGLAALIVKWATIFVFTFMGLQFTGIGEDIIRIFFGALVIGAAVAGALAFGIGGREWASRKLEQMDTKVREQAEKPASASAGPGLGGLRRGGAAATGTTASPASSSSSAAADPLAVRPSSGPAAGSSRPEDDPLPPGA
ncbi:mechanosensitive ion channel [Qipengyuania thermophila]|uniref:mechanosensitive ion channel n=1 Tax=Qipengyuania thermophila TaxID=2509361 RepID=UPI001F4699C3|nr:mechanosensitive ion channel [Qipengyuania thermophila]